MKRFLVASVFGFAVFAAAFGRASIQRSVAVINSGGYGRMSLTNGTDMPLGSATRVYADFSIFNNTGQWASFAHCRQSYDGSTQACAPAYLANNGGETLPPGNYDKPLPTGTVLDGGLWDYHFVLTNGSFWFLGVGYLNN